MTEYFSNIKDILNGANFRTVKSAYAQIIENWDSIIGKKFAGKAEIAQIYTKYGKCCLLVHVKSSPLVQELGFFKQNIIKKIKENYATDIGEIIIKASAKAEDGIEQNKETEILEVYDERPTDEDLEAITLDNEELLKIKNSVEKNSSFTKEQKEKMLSIIIKDLKTQEWMKTKGFPICQKCGRVMTRKTFGEENICNICKNTKD